MDKKPKILVVDDNSENLLLLCTLLKEEGYDTYPADSGELALASLKNIIPHLILLDVRMSGMNGFELCRLIKQQEDLAAIPIIFLSAASEIRDKLEGFRLGASDYLIKPFQKEELLVRVKTQLSIFFLNTSLKDQLSEIVELNKEHQVTIKELKKTKKKEEEAETRFRSIFENNSTAICIIEGDATISMANSEFCRISGYSKEEVVGISLAEHIPSEELRRLTETDHKEESVLSHPSQSNEFVFFKKNGEKRNALIYTSVLSSDRKIASIVDITERKILEEERQRFVMLADCSSEFIGMCDLEMKPLYVNPAGIRMVGLSGLAAACNIKVQDYFFPEDQSFIAEEFFPRVLKEDHADVEIRLRHFQTGEPIWMFYYLFSVRNANGELIGWATVSHNITSRKKAEEEIRAQLNELQRWHKVTLNRENRVLELKQEVNELLKKYGQPPKYLSVISDDIDTEINS